LSKNNYHRETGIIDSSILYCRVAVGFNLVKRLLAAIRAGTGHSFSGQAASSKIVFVNSDSLMDDYALFKDVQDNMEKKRDSLDQLLTNRGKALEREPKEYQDNAAGYERR
jgi:Skp family chaperone for outer membrane proteins